MKQSQMAFVVECRTLKVKVYLIATVTCEPGVKPQAHEDRGHPIFPNAYSLIAWNKEQED